MCQTSHTTSTVFTQTAHWLQSNVFTVRWHTHKKASDATVSLGGVEIVLGQKPVQQTVDVGVTVSGKRALNCSSLITGLVARACVYWLVK